MFRGDEVAILSDIILAAYSDALCTDTWTRVLDMVGQIVPYDAATAVFANVQTGRLENRIMLNLDADFLRWYDEHYPVISLIAETAQIRGLTVWRPSDVIGKQEYEASEIRQDLVRDFRFGEPVCATCGSPPSITARFTFLRKNGKSDYSDRDICVLKLLQPHFCEALCIAKALLDASIYQDAFQHAMRPVFICDCTGKVMDLNMKAQQLLRSGVGDCNDALVEIETMAQRMISEQEEVVSTELVGRKCQVNLSALATPNVPTSYLLVLTMPEQLRQALYSFMHESGLSDREVEICTMVARGMHNQDIADKLFIAESTVKDHVSSIFEKLGISSRSSIVPKLLGF